MVKTATVLFFAGTAIALGILLAWQHNGRFKYFYRENDVGNTTTIFDTRTGTMWSFGSSGLTGEFSAAKFEIKDERLVRTFLPAEDLDLRDPKQTRTKP
jgi:hypothetical protein